MLDGHPLPPAWLYRARLEAVRRQAAADGQAIDPWHLAAMREGLRLRMDHTLHTIDRGAIFAAARTAFGLHQWITAPEPWECSFLGALAEEARDFHQLLRDLELSGGRARGGSPAVGHIARRCP